MRILDKSRCDFLSNCEIWRVRPDTIDTELQIFIVGPEGTWPAETRFGVTFTTDAEQFGNIVPSMTRTLTAFGDIYPSYTVSIGYAPNNTHSYSLQRIRDLTPDEWPEYASFFTETLGERRTLPTGKALAFLNFITDELQPALNAAYALNLEESTLTGHDLGGLFALFALLNKPEAFQNYLAISPTLWWHDGSLITQAQHVASSTTCPKAKLFMCTGALATQSSNEAIAAALPEELQSRLPKGILNPDTLGHAQRMEQALSSWKNAGMSIQHAVIPNENQGSVIGAGLSQGLRALSTLSEVYENAENENTEG